MSLHCTATTAATIADGVESPQHSIFEKRVVNVTAFMFGLKNGNGFTGGDPPGPVGMVFGDKPGKRFANDQTHVDRGAGLGAGHPTGAVKNNNMVRVLQNNVPRPRVRDNPFQIGQADRFFYGDQLFGILQRDHFTVICVGNFDFPGICFSCFVCRAR